MAQESRLRTVWYLPLEKVQNRYTEQMRGWVTDSFKRSQTMFPHQFVVILGDQEDDSINTGVVLDAFKRSRYAMSQVSRLLREMELGRVNDGDVIYFQDYWHPGIEAIPYALHMMGLHGVRFYTFNWAQSVDMYDFTYGMKRWMRGIELGYDQFLDGVFVGSTIHKDLMRKAGFTAPIHVTGQNISYDSITGKMQQLYASQKQVIFSSRLDKEKRPEFMLNVAERFLEQHTDWKWVISTGAPGVRSNVEGVASKVKKLSVKQSRFVVKVNMTKQDYYDELQKSAIQFNCSLQDFVSFTLLEACIARCDIAYPDFRSFKECVPSDRRYHFDPDNDSPSSALYLLEKLVGGPRRTHDEIARRCNRGRLMLPNIMLSGEWGLDTDDLSEFNVWKENRQWPKKLK